MEIEPIPEKHQIGAVLAGLGWFFLLRRGLALAPSKPHSPERLTLLLYGLIASALLAYAWGVLMAYMARARAWAPRTCRSAGFPLLLLGMFGGYLAAVGGPNLRAIANFGVAFGGFLAADLAGRICRKLAYPELGWSGKDPGPASLSIRPLAPSQADRFGSGPIG